MLSRVRISVLIRKCVHFLKQVHTGFVVVKATLDDRREILRLMKDVFYKTDPSSVYSKVSENTHISPVIQDMSLESLDENLSFIAKSKQAQNNVIGAAINGTRPVVISSTYMETLFKQVESKREKDLLELWKFISAMPPDSHKFFEGETQVFEIRYLVVDQSYRNKGIATALVNHSRREAAARGYKFVRVDCTSSFTARIAAAAGMRCIYELNYQDYQNSKGEHIFKEVVVPHVKIAVYIGKSTP